MGQLSPDLDRLPIGGVELPDSVNVGPMALLASLAQPDLRFGDVALQVVVDNVEILEGWELDIAHERRLDEELALLGVDVESVAGVDADFLADTRDEAVHFLIEVSGIVNDVEVRVANPCGGRVVVQLSRQLHSFRSASMIL